MTSALGNTVYRCYYDPDLKKDGGYHERFKELMDIDVEKYQANIPFSERVIPRSSLPQKREAFLSRRIVGEDENDVVSILENLPQKALDAPVEKPQTLPQNSPLSPSAAPLEHNQETTAPVTGRKGTRDSSQDETTQPRKKPKTRASSQS